VSATKTPGDVDRAQALTAFERERCGPARAWANGPGDRYERHEHAEHKVLFCLEGSIVFHTDGADIALDAGDRIDLPAGTLHAATVGPEGCSCVEAYRTGRRP
jgi:uncharacterized protein YjlB